MTSEANTDKDEGLMPTWKRLFLRGLGALLPTLVTLVILVKLIGFINNNFGRYIGLGLTHATSWVFPDVFAPSGEAIRTYLKDQGKNPAEADDADLAAVRERLRKERFSEVAGSWQMSLIGFLLALVLVCVIGLLLASFVGRQLWRTAETTLTRIPVVKQIYPHVKQVTDYVFGERRVEFSQVVAVQYPRKGIWSMGFVTGPAIRTLRRLDDDFITVFIPSSPTPLTGYVITVLKSETVDLEISIDDALKFSISGGVITPGLTIPGRESLPEKDHGENT